MLPWIALASWLMTRFNAIDVTDGWLNVTRCPLSTLNVCQSNTSLLSCWLIDICCPLS